MHWTDIKIFLRRIDIFQGKFKIVILFVILSTLWSVGLWYSIHTYSDDVWNKDLSSAQSHEFETILTNNMIMVVRNIFSFVFLAVPAIVNVFLNGYIFGLHLTKYGVNGRDVLMHIAPYAIFELAGLFLSTIVSINFSMHLLKFMLKGIPISRQQLEDSLLSIVLVFILIFIGAVLESLMINEKLWIYV